MFIWLWYSQMRDLIMATDFLSFHCYPRCHGFCGLDFMNSSVRTGRKGEEGPASGNQVNHSHPLRIQGFPWTSGKESKD